jgi:plasmid stability protein
MWRTCYYAGDMTKMIQIRNVPDDLHRRLKERSAQMGMSLSDYLKRELARVAETPTLDEMIERIRRRSPVKLQQPIEDIIRADRESH